jgi:hypothetical protein
MSRMFTAYIDDTGTDPNQKVALATALIIPAGRISPMEHEWNRLKKKEGFSCFHMAEFSARNLKSEFADWSKPKHARVFRRVREITKKYGLVTVSFAVYKKDYDEVVPTSLMRSSGKFHYSWAIRHVLDWILKWRTYGTTSSKPLEYELDWMKEGDERRDEIEEILAQAEEASIQLTGKSEFENYNFRHRCDFPGLQCVDMLGWISYQFALLAFCKKPLFTDASVGWSDLERHNKKLKGLWRTVGTLKRSELERWVAAEREDARSRKFFDAWETKKIAEQGKRGKRRVRKV